jgi:pimeloyl-ACP methyl ester carboxylesterase
VPSVVIDGIVTRYEISGSGPPLLMFSPGGFDSRLENWTSHGLYARLDVLRHLSSRYTCVTFDRRESGQSGGRLERITWAHYVAQGKGLLDHLGIDQAHLMGACVGCSTAAMFAVLHPASVRTMVLFSPAGGPRYRLRQHLRFAEHAAYVEAFGLPDVVELACSSQAGFSDDPRVGPWVSVIRGDASFAKLYAEQDRAAYLLLVGGMARTLFDRDTVPGAEAEDLLRLDVPALIVPGQDTSHAPSAARYLQECLARAEYWDMPVHEQTEQNAPARVLQFLDDAERGGH